MNNTITNILIVGAGSCFGGIARYIINKLLESFYHGMIPWSTFIVNIVGCFVIGLIYGFIDKGFQLNDGIKLFMTVGFCGSFTTFSTFMYENHTLLSNNENLLAILYTIASIAIGLLMVYLAYYLVKATL